MKILVYFLAGVLGLGGLLFLVAAGQGNAVARVVISLVLFAAAAMLVALTRLRPIEQTHVHRMQLDLPGDTALKKLTCNQCGGELSDKSVTVAAGAVLVRCEYCGAQYQLEEAPKW